MIIGAFDIEDSSIVIIGGEFVMTLGMVVIATDEIIGFVVFTRVDEIILY